MEILFAIAIHAGGGRTQAREHRRARRTAYRARTIRLHEHRPARLIRQLNDSLGLTTLLVSHDLDETFHIADQVIILANGRIAAQGTPQEVRHSTDPLVHQFVTAAPEGPVRFHHPAPDRGADFGLGRGA